MSDRKINHSSLLLLVAWFPKTSPGSLQGLLPDAGDEYVRELLEYKALRSGNPKKFHWQPILFLPSSSSSFHSTRTFVAYDTGSSFGGINYSLSLHTPEEWEMLVPCEGMIVLPKSAWKGRRVEIGHNHYLQVIASTLWFAALPWQTASLLRSSVSPCAPASTGTLFLLLFNYCVSWLCSHS